MSDAGGGQKRALGPLEVGLQMVMSRCWKQNLGPVEVQPVLSTVESSLQPH